MIVVEDERAGRRTGCARRRRARCRDTDSSRDVVRHRRGDGCDLLAGPRPALPMRGDDDPLLAQRVPALLPEGGSICLHSFLGLGARCPAHEGRTSGTTDAKTVENRSDPLTGYRITCGVRPSAQPCVFAMRAFAVRVLSPTLSVTVYVAERRQILQPRATASGAAAPRRARQARRPGRPDACPRRRC